MIKILEDMDKCCGCGACVQICPQNAITMEIDKFFEYPKIEDTKCIDCSLCQKKCPIINFKHENFHKPKCYAVCANDELRLESSSGAAFPVLAKRILNNGGYVAGASFDENFSVEHILVSNDNDLDKLKTSKYVQSDTKNVFNEIKSLLNINKQVLFSGTPCQVAALNSFLDKKYDNLITIDLVCHGVPSPVIWQKHLKELFPDSKIEYVNFRNKRIKFQKTYLSIKDDKQKTYHNELKNDAFMFSFFQHANIRKSCGSCQFNSIPRQGDITIGDFWGIDNSKQEYSDGKGVSVVLINNNKSTNLLKSIQHDFIVVEQKEISLATAKNENIIKPSVLHHKRDVFLSLIDNHTIADAMNMTNNNICDVMILNYWRYLNVGAILTAYALQKTLDKLGFSNQLISYCHEETLLDLYPKSVYANFEKKYLKTTPLLNKSELKQLNNHANNFIVGSDQVWNNSINREDNSFYLDFVAAEKKKIACSTSFGFAHTNGSIESKALAKHWIKQFDSVSTREKSGVNICQTEMEISAQHILDPVFALTANDYSTIASNAICTTKNYIAVYSILPINSIKNQIESIAKKTDSKIMYLDVNGTKNTVENWLDGLKNCKILITDSFHGISFALIFNRPFIHIEVNNASERIKSLFNTFDIQNRSIDFNNPNIELATLYDNFDWVKINNIIEIERVKIKDFLNASLNADISKRNLDVELINHILRKENVQTTVRKVSHFKIFKLKILKIRYGLKKGLSFNKNKRDKYKSKYKLVKKQLKELEKRDK